MSEPAPQGAPGGVAALSVLVVMGVSGSGKTTIATLLAARLGWRLADADAFHPADNVRKMKSGTPLADEDRWPWLHAIAAWIDSVRAGGGRGVIACSALKRSYRNILIGGRHDVRLVYLKGDADLIARRSELRRGHFMPPSLLQSQFAMLEEPDAGENPVTVSIDAAPAQIVARIIAKLGENAPPAG